MTRWREASPLIKASAGLHGAAIVSVAVAPQTTAVAAAAVVANHLVIAAAMLVGAVLYMRSVESRIVDVI